MKKTVTQKIEERMTKTFEKDSKLNSASLRIYSDSKGIDLHRTYGEASSRTRPLYMASVGKLFTSTLIGILRDQNKLNFTDNIQKYVDEEMMNQLHVVKGEDSSNTITIQHLLTHRSGLDDAFWPLLESLKKDSSKRYTVKELITYSKTQKPAKYPVGKKVHYTDTNYYILGHIIEKVTSMSFEQAMHEYVFDPLNMENTSMLHKTQAKDKNTNTVVPFNINDVQGDRVSGYADIDYAGGSVVSTLDDLLLFMRSLTEGELVNEDTLNTMKGDTYSFFPGIEYGYGIWTIQPIPIIIPKKYYAWGVIGVLGSFMFYHPSTKTYLVGSFNDTRYERKCIRFVMKVLRDLHSA